MRWEKFILLVQAVITLVIGLTLLTQAFSVDKKLSDFNNTKISQIPEFQTLQDWSFRFNTGSYILVSVGIIEILIISSLMAYRAD